MKDAAMATLTVTQEQADLLQTACNNEAVRLREQGADAEAKGESGAYYDRLADKYSALWHLAYKAWVVLDTHAKAAEAVAKAAPMGVTLVLPEGSEEVAS